MLKRCNPSIFQDFVHETRIVTWKFQKKFQVDDVNIQFQFQIFIPPVFILKLIFCSYVNASHQFKESRNLLLAFYGQDLYYTKKT